MTCLTFLFTYYWLIRRRVRLTGMMSEMSWFWPMTELSMEMVLITGLPGRYQIISLVCENFSLVPQKKLNMNTIHKFLKI